ncbi:ParB N-terminal domain-containing protein [Mesorhizobium sp. AR02]|uniref:site-specific DNA-methyltransferase n=1 Tax=Mesorhizobium sp. AR02 TaxID=2865837 RepID=UPI00215EFAA3|nr:DNA methyltransferase [Mesorhizobium sp. AR02]UVK55341.1 ParB N-terminal domain-containing protein [Mesorhizobium sp. AR02]
MAVIRTKKQVDRLEAINAKADRRLASLSDIARHSPSSQPGEKPSLSPATHSPVIEQIPPARLKPHPSNAKTHSKKQIGQIARSVKRFGFQSPVIINADNVVLAGHGRIEAAKLLGLALIPCLRVTGLSDAEERAFVIADNKIAANGGWDRGILAESLHALMLDLPQLEIPDDLSITGFESGEIEAILSDHELSAADPADDIGVAPAGSPIVTRRGDLWLLGDHRLVCGDARDPASVDKLMAGKCADVAIIDPPWNVEVTGHIGGRGKTRHAEFAFASGEMNGRQYRRFLAASLKRLMAACKDGALIYVFIDWRHIEVLCEVGRTAGLVLRNICIWNKTTPGQGSFYRSAHELVVVFQKPGAAAVNNIALGKFGRSRTNVWTFASPNKFKDTNDPLSGHPTPKPVTMIAEAIKDASHRRGIVLDSFLGSGTTILAAEKVGRLGYGIEYEPVYCDLSIRRWQAFTGKDAVLSTTGQTFDEIAAAAQPNGPPAILKAPFSV